MNATHRPAGPRRSRLFAVLTAPEPFRVYQRSAANAAAIEIAGALAPDAAGTVESRLLQARKPLLDWRPLRITGRSFADALPDVPVGGPYTLELRLRDGDTVRPGPRIPGLLVGDLWVLAGQSNMEGCGGLVGLEPPSPHVNAFCFGDYWAVARDPLCWFNEATEPVYWREPDPAKRPEAARRERAARETGAGLGIRFGKDLHRATGVPVGLVMCALGGSSMAQWSPRLKDQGPRSLYGATLRRIAQVGGRVAGCLWWQGETDALENQGRQYPENMRELITSLRADLGRPDLPFLYVQLAPFHSWDPNVTPAGWNKVQNDQLVLEKELPQLAFAAALDATLSDPIHIDAASQRRIGARLARLALHLNRDRHLFFERQSAAATEIGPRPARVEFENAERTKLRVTFEGVNRALLPARGIRGFSIEQNGMPQEITSCVRGADGRSVLITLAAAVPPGASLWYARGFFPVCNLVDAAAFPAPVFGPVALA
jgi:sialate O-acetylesterase